MPHIDWVKMHPVGQVESKMHAVGKVESSEKLKPFIEKPPLLESESVMNLVQWGCWRLN